MKFLQKPRVRKTLAVIAAVLVLHTVFSFIITKIVYDTIFDRYDCTPPAQIPQQHRSIALLAEPVTFPSGENMLSGRFFDSPGDELVVLVQGINSHMESHYPEIQRIVEQDLRDVFIFDMTGSCESEGDSTRGFAQAVYDLDAALDYIDDSYDYEKIFLFGHSRGAFAVCCVLEDRDDIDGVVAINGPNSAMETVVGTAAARVGGIAYGNYPMLWLYQAILFGADDVAMSASEIISESDVPVLIVQAEEDDTIPPDTISIYSHRDEIEAGNVEFLLLPGGHSSVLHETGKIAANPELMDASDAFFDKHSS